MPIDDADGADLQIIDVGNVKKLALAVISQILNDHAYLLCSLTHQIGEIPPLWWCLSLQLCLWMMWTAQICKELMREM